MANDPNLKYDGSSTSGQFGGSLYAAFKQIYTPGRIQPVYFKNRPFLRDCPKVADFFGTNITHTIGYESPDTGSTDIVRALNQANTASSAARFTIWRGRDYQALNISAEEIAASGNDKGALIRKKDFEIRGVFDRMGMRSDIALHGNGSGVIGSFVTPASLTGTTITLDRPQQLQRFAKGMYLQFSTNEPTDGTTPAFVNSGNTVAQVAAIQRNSITQGLSAVIDFGVALNTLTGLTASTQYYLIRAGDGVGFGVNQLNGGICGLKAWLPAPPPVGQAYTTRLSVTDNFWGFNRNVDSTRLAGCTYQAQPGEKYQVTYQQAGQELFSNGGGNEKGKMFLYVSPQDFTGYSVELGGQARYDGNDRSGASGYDNLLCYTQAGDLTLRVDPQLEQGLFYILDTDCYAIHSLGEMPHMDEQDGNQSLRLSTSDAAQYRWRSWYQLIFSNPGGCLVGRNA